MSVKDRRIPRTLTVKSTVNLTPNMRRVTLRGGSSACFPDGSEGTYIKLLFTRAGGAKPITRTYTVARQRHSENEIDVDFMLHSRDNSSVDGVAAPWSMSTQPGDQISVAGPGRASFINTDAAYFLLAADMTALPALAANLKRLPDDARGQIFVEILSEEDKQNLSKPEKLELSWVVNDNPGSDESPLFHALRQAVLPTGKLSAWVACEFKSMRKIRHYLKTGQNMEKSHLYISSYWKRGSTEEQHKIAKQADTDDRGDLHK
ncbi:MAG: siderophore-interacting protein [Gammaproteobacteria bacterium]|nr:siderophore-interacting protein [Gammaproteobacteria bacterium]